jgi:hypothetical protein
LDEGFTERFRVFRDHVGLKSKVLAERLGVSAGYITDLAHGRGKGQGGKFWDGIREQFPEWENYLRNIVSDAPSEKVTPFAERRAFNRMTGWTEEEALTVAGWLQRDPEVRDLLLGWAEARSKGSISDAEAKLLEFDVKAKAHYLLSQAKRKTEKQLPGG